MTPAPQRSGALAALGWMVFGDVPDAFTLGGAAIIIAAGLYILWREQIVTRREPALAPLP